MIEIICDNCERAFTVDDDRAGGKLPCPMCGDINRVPAAPAPDEVGTERAAAPPRGEAPVPSREAERELCVVRPAMFRAHPFRYMIILAIVLGGIGGAISSRTGDLGWLLWPGLVAAAAGVVWWVAWWIAASLWIRITITNKRTIRHEGIVRRHSTEVLHDHVRSVDIRQNFTNRLLGVGYIGIDSAGQDGIEIEIRDIPAPYEIKRLIDRYRRM